MDIKEIRNISGMSQRTFAEKYHIPKRTYEGWEIGERKPPIYVLEMLERIVKEDMIGQNNVDNKVTERKTLMCHKSREQQPEEINTTRLRTIEMKLSDEDVKSISEKAGAHGLTVAELLENFIGDLVGGTCSNGSDERMYAEQWFNRCWFGTSPDLTFLRYLIEWDSLKEIIDALDYIKDGEKRIKQSEEALASGVMKSWTGEDYTWKNLTNGDGKPCYHSLEEWEASEREFIELEQEEIADRRATIDDLWKEYSEQKKEYKNGTFDEEMKNVLDYWHRYKLFLGEKQK